MNTHAKTTLSLDLHPYCATTHLWYRHHDAQHTGGGTGETKDGSESKEIDETGLSISKLRSQNLEMGKTTTSSPYFSLVLQSERKRKPGQYGWLQVSNISDLGRAPEVDSLALIDKSFEGGGFCFGQVSEHLSI